MPGESKKEHQWVPEILQVELPAEPEGECDPEVEDRVVNFMRKNEQLGQSLTQNLVNLKSFRNPNIFTKLIEVFGIREYGSNFPPESGVDLYSLPKESFYDELWRAQKAWNEQRERDRAKRTEISFVGAKTDQQQHQQQVQQQLAAATSMANPRGTSNRAAGVARMLQSRMTGGIFSGSAAPTPSPPPPDAKTSSATAATTGGAAPKRKSKWDEQASATASTTTSTGEGEQAKRAKTE